MDVRMQSAVLASALALGCLGFVGHASAHARLTAASPTMGAIVGEAPTDLVLSFSEGVNPKFSGVNLTGPDGAAVPTGDAELGVADDQTLVIHLSGKLLPGAYKVGWRALATDGHKTEGLYTFTVAP